MYEGCLYKGNDNYYLISSIASYKILAVEFKTFKQYSMEIENFDYKLIDYTPDNIKELLDNYEEFKDNIYYSDLKDFEIISYLNNNKNYYIRSWLDVFNFAKRYTYN
jgi:hypothetical protein